jgi:transposase, IS6 family
VDVCRAVSACAEPFRRMLPALNGDHASSAGSCPKHQTKRIWAESDNSGAKDNKYYYSLVNPIGGASSLPRQFRRCPSGRSKSNAEGRRKRRGVVAANSSRRGYGANLPSRPVGLKRKLRTDMTSIRTRRLAGMTAVGSVALAGPVPVSQTGAVIRSNVASCAPAGYRFPREVIAVAVRWYLRYGLSYRDVKELLAERGIEVDHVTVYRWVQTFTPEFIDAARPARHVAGDRWFVDETYVKVAGRWSYLYRAVDQHGQVIDVLVSTRRNAPAARSFFARALRLGPVPVEFVTDRAPAYPQIVDEMAPAARHITER